MQNLVTHRPIKLPDTNFCGSWATEIEAASNNLYAAASELGVGALSKPMISASTVSGPNGREWLHADSRGAWIFLHRDPHGPLNYGIWVAVQNWIITQQKNGNSLTQ